MKLSWPSSGGKKQAASSGAAAPASAPGRTTASGRTIDTMLMATDLSPRSANALARAMERAAAHQARLTVLHVLDEDLPATARERGADAAREEIGDHIARIGRPDGLDVSIEVVPGKDYQDILRVAEAKGADLIVTGVHRTETGLRAVSGSTMERVIRKGAWPVLVVADEVRGAYGKIVVAVDFSVYSRFAIRNAVALAPEAEFYFVHAFIVPFAGFQTSREIRQEVREGREEALAAVIREEMDALIASTLGAPEGPQEPKGGAPRPLEERCRCIVRHGDVNTVLMEEIESLSPDLLVLGTHGRVGIAHAVLGSVAERFINHPPCDVMAVKAW